MAVRKTIGDLQFWDRAPPQQVPQQAAPQPSGIDADLEALRPGKRDTWRDVLGSIFDAMSAFGGGEANYWNNINEGQQQFEDLQRRMVLTRQMLAAKAQERREDREAALAEPTGAMRTFQQWQGLDDADKQAWADYNTATKPPQFVPDGYGGGQWVTPGGGGLPQGYDPDEWEVVPGGATGNPSPSFP